MPLPVVLFVVLFALPGVLMAVAHVYGVLSQDRTESVVVTLLPGAPLNAVTNDHVLRHGVRVHRMLPAANGYTGSVRLSRRERLVADDRVAAVTSSEP